MRIRNMGQKEICDLLLGALADYVASYDHAVEKLETTFDRHHRIEFEKVIGKCVQRIAGIKAALDDMTKAKTRDVLKQIQEDTMAAYEEARVAAEKTPFMDERTQQEKIKAHCVKRRLLIVAALAELT
jgi:hypothetical protein